MHLFRIGGVPYGVGAPLLAGLEERQDVRLRCLAPRALVRELRAGRMDAALVSSIEAFRVPGYLAMHDLGIASTGAVRSVRMFLRTEPEQVGSLAADHSSETSLALARILLEKRFGAGREPDIEDLEPTLRPDEVDADAVLLIGDAGLHADPGRRRTLDLGEEWYAFKGLPFVFALWLIRADGEREARLLRYLREAWPEGQARGVDDGTGGRIQYELGSDHMRGLEAFHAEAKELGLCPPDIRPRWSRAEHGAAHPE